MMVRNGCIAGGCTTTDASGCGDSAEPADFHGAVLDTLGGCTTTDASGCGDSAEPADFHGAALAGTIPLGGCTTTGASGCGASLAVGPLGGCAAAGAFGCTGTGSAGCTDTGSGTKRGLSIQATHSATTASFATGVKCKPSLCNIPVSGRIASAAVVMCTGNLRAWHSSANTFIIR